MFKRLFGSSKSKSQSTTSEEERKQQNVDADVASTEAMMKIKSTMDDLQKK